MKDDAGRASGSRGSWVLLSLAITIAILACVGGASEAGVAAQHGEEGDVVRTVLAEFYNATGGPQWYHRCAQEQNNNNNGSGCWLDPASPDYCQWLGITCRPGPRKNEADGGEVGVELTDGGSGNSTLIAIALQRNNLRGSLETVRFDALGAVLESLDLDRNELEGPVPSSLCHVAALAQLRMSNNHLTGPVPDCFNISKQLIRLDLSSNLLTGPLPESLFRNPSLEFLILASNLINGSLPKLYGATNLTKLVLSSNHLQGKFPQDIQYLNNLVQVSLDHNQFTDAFDDNNFVPYTRIMSAIDVAHNKYELIGSINNLSGYIPARIAELVRGGSMSYISFANNPRMVAQGKGAPVPPYLALLDSELTLKDRRKYYCKSVIVAQGGLLAVEVSPEYFDYHHCSCSRGFHGKPPSDCEGCPTNCQCDQGGNVLTWPVGYYPIISSDNPSKELRVVTAEACPAGGYACNPHGNCSFVWNQGISPGCSLCSLGSSGRLCSKCHCGQYGDCYYLNYKSQCLLCERVARSTIVGGALLLVFAAVVAALVWLYKREQCRAALENASQGDDGQCYEVIGEGNEKNEEEEEEEEEEEDDQARPVLQGNGAGQSDSADAATAQSRFNIHGHILNESGKLRLLILYWQASSLLNNRWPHWTLEYGMRFLSIFDPQTTEFGLECLFPALADPFNDLVVNLLIVPVLSLLLVLVVAVWVGWRYTASRLLRSKRPSPSIETLQSPHMSTNDGDRSSSSSSLSTAVGSCPASEHVTRPIMWGANVFLFILWLFYFQVCNKAFVAFPCISEAETHDSYVATLPWLSCSSDEWHRLRAVAIAGLVVYAVGVPTLFAGLYLYFLRKKALFDPDVQYTIGFFYSGYKQHTWYEAVIFLRRFALSGLIFALPPDTPFRETGLFAVLLLAISCVFLLRPYRQKLDWMLEIISLFVLVVTYIAQSEWTYLIPNYQKFDPEPDVAALVWMMLLINVGTILTFVLVMLFVVVRLPALRYLRAHGRTQGATYDLVRCWDKVVE